MCSIVLYDECTKCITNRRCFVASASASEYESEITIRAETSGTGSTFDCVFRFTPAIERCEAQFFRSFNPAQRRLHCQETIQNRERKITPAAEIFVKPELCTSRR